jgi:hypothetical protein
VVTSSGYGCAVSSVMLRTFLVSANMKHQCWQDNHLGVLVEVPDASEELAAPEASAPEFAASEDAGEDEVDADEAVVAEIGTDEGAIDDANLEELSEEEIGAENDSPEDAALEEAIAEDPCPEEVTPAEVILVLGYGNPWLAVCVWIDELFATVDELNDWLGDINVDIVTEVVIVTVDVVAGQPIEEVREMYCLRVRVLRARS